MYILNSFSSFCLHNSVWEVLGGFAFLALCVFSADSKFIKLCCLVCVCVCVCVCVWGGGGGGGGGGG